MPFRTADGRRPLDELLLAQRPADDHRFVLRAGFGYDDPVSKRHYAVAPGRVTDLASVPMWLWSFIASYGRQSAPAVLHDDRSAVAARLGDRRAALAQRREDDRVLRTALREQRVPLLRAWLMWAWVAADREREFGGAAGVVFMVQAVVGTLVVVGASVAAFWHPAWLALALLPALAALPWGGLAPLMLVLNYPTAVLTPLIALHLVALVPFRLIEAVVELVTGGDPAGVWRPTVRASRSP
ncbi:DUF1353 domain-containing protein [Agromyces sp. NPDC058484]|uniref:DUF1353 domain-containing protein n=1 Tax=Agromyces sp. NPDC058484 TaxID=3346524 RepID=UPI0036467701